MISTSLRRLRGELRLYRRRLVVVVFAVQALVLCAALLAGQAYARDQIAVSGDSRLHSCAELEDLGVPAERCGSTQKSQRHSQAEMRALAARIGPAGEASTQPVGILALVFGHASTLVGLVTLSVVATLVLGAEYETGLGRARDTGYLGRSSLPVRVAALMVAWAVATVASGVLAIVTSGLVGIEVGWRGASDHRAGLGHLRASIVGAALVATTFATLLLSARHLLATRSRWMVAAFGLTALLLAAGATGSALLPPTNAGYSLLGFEADTMSFIDRFPLTLVVDPAPVAAAIVVVVGAVPVVVPMAIGVARGALRSPAR